MENLDFLIQYLLKEGNHSVESLPIDKKDKKTLYRALVNVREPAPISDEFLENEDQYLQEELKEKGITDVSTIKTIKEKYEKYRVVNGDKICLWQGDITKLKIGAIVNAGNSQGLGCFLPNHNCIDNQINTFAGVRLRLACNEVMKKLNYHLETGKAMMTKGYNLPAEYVIQTVGPIIENNVSNEDKILLANCYQNSLKLAMENGIKTIAFPCVSTGVFRFPKDEASKIALKAVDELIDKNRDKFDKVILNLWSKEDVRIYEENIEGYQRIDKSSR